MVGLRLGLETEGYTDLDRAKQKEPDDGAIPRLQSLLNSPRPEKTCLRNPSS